MDGHEGGREGGREGRTTHIHTHNVLGSHDQLVVQHPLRALVEESGGRVDVHQIVIDDGLESFLGVFFGDVREVAGADGLLDLLEVPT